jgi:hypothetical protein
MLTMPKTIMFEKIKINDEIWSLVSSLNNRSVGLFECDLNKNIVLPKIVNELCFCYCENVNVKKIIEILNETIINELNIHIDDNSENFAMMIYKKYLN